MLACDRRRGIVTSSSGKLCTATGFVIGNMPDLERCEQLVTEEPGYLNTSISICNVAHPQEHCVMHTK